MEYSTLKWINVDLKGLEDSGKDGYRICFKIEEKTEYTGLISRDLLLKNIVKELAISLYYFNRKHQDKWETRDFFYMDADEFKVFKHIGLVFRNYIHEINSEELFLECARHINNDDSPGIKAITVIDETTNE